jgi:hypothetical protein
MMTKMMKVNLRLFPHSMLRRGLLMHYSPFLPMTTVMRMKRRNLFLLMMALLFAYSSESSVEVIFVIT